MDQEKAFFKRLEGKGVSRRDFMKYCTFLTATMGLSSSFVPKVAEVFAAPAQRPPVIWLHFAECTGCTEATLRSMYPWIDELVLEILDIEYLETIMAAAGHQAEEQLEQAVKKYKGKFICVVEGAIATKFNGAYGKIGGRTFLEVAKDVIPKAAGVICIGACSSFGGVQAAAPKGCRGPETYNNCPIAKFNDGTSWPIEAGHPCIGCSEPDFWDKYTPFFEEL